MPAYLVLNNLPGVTPEIGYKVNINVRSDDSFLWGVAAANSIDNRTIYRLVDDSGNDIGDDLKDKAKEFGMYFEMEVQE